MPVLRYYDQPSAQYIALPGLPGAQGPTGPTGPPGTASPAYVAQAWLSTTSVPNSGQNIVTCTATGLIANHNYLVTGYCIGANTSAAAATMRVSVAVAGSGASPGPNAGVWIVYEANIAANQQPASGYQHGTSASFVYTPTTTGDVQFVLFFQGTSGAMTFSPNNAGIMVVDQQTASAGPTGPTGATGPGYQAGVSCRVTRSAAYPLPIGSAGVFGFDTVSWDTNSAFNTSTGVYTVPVAGRYKVFFQANVIATAASQTLAGYLRQGSTNVSTAYSGPSAVTGNYLWMQIEDTLTCAVGDQISTMLWVNTTAVNLATSGNSSYMAIDLIQSGVGPTGAVGPTGPGGTLTDSGWHYLNTNSEPALNCPVYDGSGAVWAGGRFRRDAAGCVFLDGLLVPPNAVSTTICTLPPGYRPAYEARFLVGNATNVFQLSVFPNGNVIVYNCPGGTYTTINGVTFMAEDYQNVNWVYPTLTNGWSNFGQGTAPARYYVDNVGDIHLSGVVGGGTMNAAAYTLPSNLWPDLNTIYLQISSGPANGNMRVDVQNNGQVIPAYSINGGTNAWVSLDGIVISNVQGYWWTPAPQNAWVAFGGAYATLQYSINKNGIVAVRGLLKSGTTTAGTALTIAAAIPSPPRYTVMAMVLTGGNFWGRVDINQAGTILFQGFSPSGGTNAILSIYARYFVEAEGPGVIQAGATGPTGATGPAGASANVASWIQTLTAPTVASSPYTITHNLGTTNVFVQLYDAVTSQQVQAQVAALNTNQIQVSVAVNMPNNINVLVMGAPSSPITLFPGDLATKAYVDSRTANLPAPITSGSGMQTFTDALGDIWIAQNGVSNGAWIRARTTLFSHVYRSAAMNTPSSGGTVAMDTVLDDVYNMFDGTGVTTPIGGLWLAGCGLGFTPTTTSDANCIYLVMGAGNYRSPTATAYTALNAIETGISGMRRMNANTRIYEQTEFCTVGRAVAAADGRTYLWAQYMGP